MAGRITIIGYGYVCKSLLNLVDQHNYDMKFTIISSSEFTACTTSDIALKNECTPMVTKHTFIKQRIDKMNYREILKKYCSPNGLLIDLAGCDTNDLLEFCSEHNIMFMNSSENKWDPYESIIMNDDNYIFNKVKLWKNNNTALLNMGICPGLASYFIKYAIEFLAKDKRVPLETTINEKIKKLNIKIINPQKIHNYETNIISTIDTFQHAWKKETLLEECLSKPNIIGQYDKTKIKLQSYGIDTRIKVICPFQGEYTSYVIDNEVIYSLKYMCGTNDSMILYTYKMPDFTIESFKANKYLNGKYCFSRDTKSRFIEPNERSERLKVVNGIIVNDIGEGISCSMMEKPKTSMTSIGILIGIIYILKYPKEGLKIVETIDTEIITDIIKTLGYDIVINKFNVNLESLYSTNNYYTI
jgi:homospermidine synthase